MAGARGVGVAASPRASPARAEGRCPRGTERIFRRVGYAGGPRGAHAPPAACGPPARAARAPHGRALPGAARAAHGHELSGSDGCGAPSFPIRCMVSAVLVCGGRAPSRIPPPRLPGVGPAARATVCGRGRPRSRAAAAARSRGHATATGGHQLRRPCGKPCDSNGAPGLEVDAILERDLRSRARSDPRSRS